MPARAAALWPHHDFRRHDKQAMTVREPARRRRPDHRGQHAGRQCRLEGVSGADLRQCRRAEGCRGYAGDGLAVRARSPARPGCRRASSTSCRGLAPRPGGRWSPIRDVGVLQLYRLDRASDGEIARVGGRAAAQGFARTRRQESARGLRRRRSRRRGAMDRPLGLQQCRAALRLRQPHHHFRFIYDLFRDRLLERARKLKSGRPTTTISDRSSTSGN